MQFKSTSSFMANCFLRWHQLQNRVVDIFSSSKPSRTGNQCLCPLLQLLVTHSYLIHHCSWTFLWVCPIALWGESGNRNIYWKRKTSKHVTYDSQFSLSLHFHFYTFYIICLITVASLVFHSEILPYAKVELIIVHTGIN